MFDSQTKLDLKQGDPGAFKEVFRLLYPRLKGYCKLFIKDASQVEDIIQESFIALWENRNSLKTDKSIESYVFVIVRNRCLNYLKKQKLEGEKIDLDNPEIAQLQFLYQLDFTAQEDSSLEEMLVVSLKEMIAELPEKRRAVFVKCKIEGRKQVEVANELGISIKMVEKHVAMAKNIIHEKLIKKYPALILLIAFLLD
ncbi:MAG TPA: RNA polymerase sigma-70 factor [Draconibacterium sp.]|nr:RNA polymerase sigma-70 factor [Draconibacterium sp.]